MISVNDLEKGSFWCCEVHMVCSLLVLHKAMTHYVVEKLISCGTLSEFADVPKAGYQPEIHV